MLHFLGKASFLLHKATKSNLFTSNLRERSVGGCGSIRLPGEELP